MSAAAPAPSPHRPAPGPATGATPVTGPPATRGTGATPTPTVRAGATATPAPPHLTGFRTPTPRLLVTLLSLATVVTALFGVGVAAAMLHTRSELTRAAGHTEQVARVQETRSEVLKADAAAAQLLLGDRANAPQVEVYQAALRRARGLLVAAAASHPADQDPLTRVNAELNTYSAALERVRMAPIQEPAARDELGRAQLHLRDTVLPDLDQVVAANTDQVGQAIAPVPAAVPVVLGLLAAGTLLTTAVATAIRFRRVINPGLVVAIALTLTALWVSTSTLNEANAAGARAVSSNMTTLSAAATARGIGYEARAQEAMIVLTRGDAAPVRQWAAADDALRAAGGEVDGPAQRNRLLDSWNAYTAAHGELVRSGSAGQWDRAREQALASSADTAGGTFATFEQTATEITSVARDTALERLQAPRSGLAGAAASALLATAGAIVAAFVGARTRLREYR